MDASEDLERDEIVVIETNLDDTTGEVLGWLMECLLTAGALDVNYQAIQMKKQRPGTLVRVIARPADAERLAKIIIRETPTLGVRLQPMTRLIAPRRAETVATPLGDVRVKLKMLNGQIVHASPEFVDCRQIALTQALPLTEVMARLDAWLRAYYELDETPTPPTM